MATHSVIEELVDSHGFAQMLDRTTMDQQFTESWVISKAEPSCQGVP